MGIVTFSDFINEDRYTKDSHKHRLAAGIAMVYDNRLLLIHPTNASWKKPSCGIPKGKMEKGEDSKTAAVREFMEETGIEIPSYMLEGNDEKFTLDFYDSQGRVTGHLIYYLCKINDLSEIGLESERIPKSQLQLEEVDWGKFVPAEEAYPITAREQLIIIDRHLTLNK